VLNLATEFTEITENTIKLFRVFRVFRGYLHDISLTKCHSGLSPIILDLKPVFPCLFGLVQCGIDAPHRRINISIYARFQLNQPRTECADNGISNVIAHLGSLETVLETGKQIFSGIRITV
jgi:hypothetical protein